MSLPPKDTSPSDLWTQISETPRPASEFQMPGVDKNGQPFKPSKIWIMTESERMSCCANASKVAKEFCGGDAKAGDLGYEEIYRNEQAVELVSFCWRVHEDPRFPIAPSAKLVRQKLTTDQIALVADAYGQFRAQSGPMLSELTVPEMEAWLKVLLEGASRVPLAQLSGLALSDLVMFLVSKIKSLQTATGSAGSPPSDSSTERSEEPPTDLVDESEKLPSE